VPSYDGSTLDRWWEHPEVLGQEPLLQVSACTHRAFMITTASQLLLHQSVGGLGCDSDFPPGGTLDLFTKELPVKVSSRREVRKRGGGSILVPPVDRLNHPLVSLM